MLARKPRPSPNQFRIWVGEAPSDADRGCCLRLLTPRLTYRVLAAPRLV